MEKWEVGNGTVRVTSEGLLQCGLEMGEKYDRKKRPEEHAEDSPTPHTHTHPHAHIVPQVCTGAIAYGCVTLYSVYSRATQSGLEAAQQDAKTEPCSSSSSGCVTKRGESKENLTQISNFSGSELR